MFILENDVVKTDLTLDKLKELFPKQAHLFKKPLKFSLHPSFFRPDLDNPESAKPIVRVRHFIPIAYVLTDPTTKQSKRYRYFSDRVPHNSIPGQWVYQQKHIKFDHGHLVVDISPNAPNPDLAKVFILLMHPKFGVEFVIEDNVANARLAADVQEARFKAMRYVHDSSFKDYIKDSDLIAVAQQLGVNNAASTDRDVLRNILGKMAETTPEKFKQFKGTKKGIIAQLVTEAQDYKIVQYDQLKKLWFLTTMIENGNQPLRQRNVEALTHAQNAKTSTDDLVKFLADVDPNNNVGRIEILLNEEKLRIERIAKDIGIAAEDVIDQISIQKSTSK